jgi:hypothetical protein
MKHTKASLIVILVFALVTAIFGASYLAYHWHGSAPSGVAQIPVDYKNLTYVIENTPVALVNGYSEMPAAQGSASNIITRYFGNEATGDLNGDGRQDAVFLLTQETGGSGTFYYVAAALGTASGYQAANTIFLGDRIAPQTTELANGIITVNYADRPAGEPMTAQPSLGVSRYFTVVNGVLVENK